MRTALIASFCFLLACSDQPPVEQELIPASEFDMQGHRGSRGHLPENSIPGFILALEQGATTLELDLVVSADSQLVVNHEPWLNPEICKTPAGEPVREAREWNLYRMPMEQIRGCDCGSRPHPTYTTQEPMAVNRPALWEVVQVTDHMRTRRDSIKPSYNIEIKFRDEGVNTYHPDAETFARLVIDEVNALGIKERTTIQSFSAKALDAIHALDPEISTAWLVEDDAPVKDHLSRLSFTPDIYSPYHQILTPEKISEAHAKGIAVIPWTINEKDRMNELMQWGVDGIISDYPDRLWEVVMEAKENS